MQEYCYFSTSESTSHSGILRLLLTVFLALVAISPFTKSAYGTETYAPVRKWAVDNWYQGTPQAHRRGFADVESSFKTDWTTFEPPCSTAGQFATWNYESWFYYQNTGYQPESLGGATYIFEYCASSDLYGPYNYPSASLRHWICADGVWYDPLREGYPEICTLEDNEVEPDKNKGAPPCPDQCFGDPVNAGTGNKFEARVEYRGPGEFPLEFSWTYNSKGSSPASDPYGDMVGFSRSTTFSRRISVSTSEGITTAYVSRPSGSSLRFNKQGSIWVSSSGVPETLVAAGTPIQSWIFEDTSGNRDYFDADGRLLAIANPDGKRITITYDSLGRIESAADESNRKLIFNYGPGSLLESLTLPEGSSLLFDYNTAGYLEKTTYPGGTFLSYLYDEGGYVASSSEGALTGMIDESGTRYSTHYDAAGKATSTDLGGLDAQSATYVDATVGGYASSTNITMSSGGSRQIEFEIVKGRVVPSSVTTTCSGCVGQNIAYAYDGNGYIDTITRNGVVSNLDYDFRGLPTQKIEAANDTTGKKRTTQTDWHAAFRVPTERRTYNAANTLVAKSTWTYNTRGQALTASQIDPVTSTARTTTMTYCEQADITAGTCPLLGLVKSVNGPRTDVTDTTTHTYYPSDDATCASAPTTCPHRKGDLWKVTNALGQVSETLAYDGAGRVRSVKDANGVITDLEYHPRGWLSARKTRGTNNAVETDDQITQIQYWPTGLVKKVIQPDGAFTAYTYDAAHRLTDIADNAGNTIHYTLDNAGNRTQEDTKDPGNVLKRTLSRVYNQLGQLQTQADAQANPTDFAYDANGNTDTVTDALGRVTDNDYDPLNRLSRTLQNVGGINAETKFVYDAQDNLTQVTDPKGLNTTYTYNGLSDLTQLSSPDTGITLYTYDSGGNRKTQTDARNQTSTYSYDVLNRLTGIAYATTSLNVAYAYDTSQAACITGETFAKGRLTKLTDASGSTQYCYDRFGNLVRKVQTTNGVALTVRYAYTLAGQLSSVTYPDGAVATYTRDAQGRTTQVNVQRAGAASEVLLNQASYHPFGPVAGWTYGNGRQLLRPLNQNYQPTAIQDASTGGLSVGFQYDAVGNLTQLTPAGSATPLVKFDYDALSRLTKFKDGPTDVAIESYAYDATGNRQSFTNSAGTQAYTYPSTSHRLSQVGATTRSYDNAGNTTAIGGTAKEFVYDDTGRMSQVKQNAIVQRIYAYNGKGEQVRKYLGTSSTYTVYDEFGHWLGDYDSTGAALQQAIWLDDLPVGLIANGNQLHYIEPDHLGTPRVVIEVARNAPVWTWDLKSEVFGNSVPNQDPDGDATLLVFDMRFPGQLYDANTGMNYNYFRDYDSASGRYVQSDPIGLDGGPSTYSYVEHAPLGYVDPAGLQRAIIRPWWESSPIPLSGQEGLNEGQLSSSDPWDISTAADGTTARDWGRPVGRAGRNGDWCVMKCKAEEIGVSGRGRTQGGCACPDFIYGLGLGFNPFEAWNNAWNAANINTPRGCMKKHCNGLAGSCRGWKGGKMTGGRRGR